MKVLFVSQYFFPEQFSNNDIVKYLVAQGHEVQVITAVPNYPRGRIFEGYGFFKRTKEEVFGASVRRVPAMPRGNGSALRLAMNYISFAFFGSVYSATLLFQKKPDIIFCSQSSPITMAIPAVIAKWITRKKLVIWTQDLWPESVDAIIDLNRIHGGRLLKRLIGWISKMIYRSSDLILIQSKLFEGPIKQLAPTVKTEYWPNSTDPSIKALQSSKELEESLGVEDDSTVFVYAGNIGETQNPLIIVEAAKKLTDLRVKFLILGEGRAKSKMVDRAKALGVDHMFIFTGSVAVEKVADYLAIGDAALLTLKDVKVFSLTIPYRMQTFLASGKPVISCGGEAVQEILNDAQCGYSSAPEDVQNFANNLRKFFLLDEKARKVMSSNALKYSEKNFARATVYDALVKHFERVSGKVQTGNDFS